MTWGKWLYEKAVPSVWDLLSLPLGYGLGWLSYEIAVGWVILAAIVIGAFFWLWRLKAKPKAAAEPKGAAEPPKAANPDVVDLAAVRELLKSANADCIAAEETLDRLALLHGENLLKNASFESWESREGLPLPADWVMGNDPKKYPEGLGAIRTAFAGRGAATESVLFETTKVRQCCWLYQKVPLRSGLYLLGGWSKAHQVISGTSDYSILAEWRQQCKASTGSCQGWLEQKVCLFESGDHDWQLRAGVFLLKGSPEKWDVGVHVILRGNRTGTAWFDDVFLYRLGD